ncbi:MAG: MotA/TolQ/ExbB proton channel, partial [Planctomycetaceae bacterium]|nr:MotA/TolQ/ExbB proton channel [Planctomycetaceae bacterium]
MPETFETPSGAFSRRDNALGYSAANRSLATLAVVAWGLLLPVIASAQAPPAEPDLGAAAPIGAEDLAKPAAAAGAVVNPAADPFPAPEEKSYLIPTDPIQLFLAGGFLMWPILLSSVISLWFVLERMVVLRRRRVIPRAFVDRFIQHLEQGKLNAETALRLCEENLSPIADVFAHGIRKWGKTSVEVEQAIIDGGERQISQLRTHLRIINGVATVAPLLGLLGTVVGMIMSFNELAQGGDADRAQRLAGGIGVALITTAAGLFVAIPSLILYMFLSGRVDGLVMEMDGLAQKVVNLISNEGLASRPRTNVAKTNSAPV